MTIPRLCYYYPKAVDVPDDPHEYEIRKTSRTTLGYELFATTDNEANAALIVTAVNTHERMKAVLLDAKACLDNLKQVQQWDKDTGDHIDEAEDLLGKVCALLTDMEG